MGVIDKDSLKIPRLTGIPPHGPLTVNALPSCLVGTGPWEIYVMGADGGNQRNLTNNRRWNSHPSWLPDGERIVFASKKDGNMEIYVMDNDGKNQQRLTNNRHDDVDPAWFDPAFASAFAVAPAGKKLTMWSWLKQVDR